MLSIIALKCFEIFLAWKANLTSQNFLRFFLNLVDLHGLLKVIQLLLRGVVRFLGILSWSWSFGFLWLSRDLFFLDLCINYCVDLWLRLLNSTSTFDGLPILLRYNCVTSLYSKLKLVVHINIHGFTADHSWLLSASHILLLLLVLFDE